MDSWVTIAPQVNGINTELLNNFADTLRASYRIEPMEHLKIEPAIEFARGNPIVTWVLPGGLAAGSRRRRAPRARARRAHGHVLQRRPRSVMLGGGYLYDEVRNVTGDNKPGLQVSADHFVTKKRTNDGFGFAQFTRKAGDFGVTVGGRYDRTSFGDAFAPRIGVTLSASPFNAKLLYGRAFRIPLPWQAYGC